MQLLLGKQAVAAQLPGFYERIGTPPPLKQTSADSQSGPFSGNTIPIQAPSSTGSTTILQWIAFARSLTIDNPRPDLTLPTEAANQDNQRFYIHYVASHESYLIQGIQSRKYLGLLGLNNGGLIIQQTKPVQVFAFERVGNILMEKPPMSTNKLPGRPVYTIQKKKAP